MTSEQEKSKFGKFTNNGPKGKGRIKVSQEILQKAVPRDVTGYAPHLKIVH